MRPVNDALKDILGPAAMERGFTGDEGIKRLSGQLERRLGYPVAASTLRCYLNGHRTPPLPALRALQEELDMPEHVRRQADQAAADHLRQQRLANRNTDPEVE